MGTPMHRKDVRRLASTTVKLQSNHVTDPRVYTPFAKSRAEDLRRQWRAHLLLHNPTPSSVTSEDPRDVQKHGAGMHVFKQRDEAFGRLSKGCKHYTVILCVDPAWAWHGSSRLTWDHHGGYLCRFLWLNPPMFIDVPRRTREFSTGLTWLRSSRGGRRCPGGTCHHPGF